MSSSDPKVLPQALWDPGEDSNDCRGRVLCVTSNFPRWRGDSTTPFVLHLARDLQALGWRVDVLAPHAPGCARTEIIDGVHVKRFRYLWPESQQTICYQGGAIVNIRKHRWNVAKLPAFVTAETLAVLSRLLRSDYDLVHSHWILPQGFAGGIACRIARIPQIVTVHGGDIFALQGRLLAGFKRFALRQTSAITVNSSVTEKAVHELGAFKSSVVRIPMGVDDTPLDRTSREVQEIRDQHCASSGPLLLFVGRVVEEKGVKDVIDAVDRLRTTLPEVRALIVGEGQDRVNFERYVVEMGLSSHIEFTGWVDPGSIPALMAASDIFIGPSRTSTDGWKEAQGLTFLEAMAAGTPVVATRSGGIVDSVIDGKTGLLVREGSPTAIAAAVRRLWPHSDLVESLTETARRHVEGRFSRRASARAFDSLFQSIIQRSCN